MNFYYNLIKMILIFAAIDYITSYFLFLFFIMIQTINFILATGIIMLFIILLILLYMKICYDKNYKHIWFLPLSHLVMFILSWSPSNYDFNMSIVLWQITMLKVIPSIAASVIYYFLIKKKGVS